MRTIEQMKNIARNDEWDYYCDICNGGMMEEHVIDYPTNHGNWMMCPTCYEERPYVGGYDEDLA